MQPLGMAQCGGPPNSGSARVSPGVVLAQASAQRARRGGEGVSRLAVGKTWLNPNVSKPVLHRVELLPRRYLKL